MTDRQMPDFEARLAERLRVFSSIPVPEVDELATARAAIQAAGPGWLQRWLSPLRAARPIAVPLVLAALLLLALLAATLTAGGAIDRLLTVVPASSPHPFVEELGVSTDRQVSSFSAIVLEDGRVLVAGGVDTTAGQVTIASAWLFDPATNRFSETGSMTTPRSGPLMALLADGRVVVIGGTNESGASTAAEGAEVYDPRTGTFRATADEPIRRLNTPQGAMDHAWASPQATTLGDGRVLISGGWGAGTVAELYDPSVDRFDEVDIGCDATRGTQVLLADGGALVTCLPDRTSDALAAVLFDPGTSTFAPTGTPTTRANDLANRLPDGRVLLTGSSFQVDPGADLFNPVTGRFTTLQVSGLPDGAAAGIDIGDGRLLFVGDPDPEFATPSRIFDTAGLEFDEVELPTFRIGEPTVRLEDGRLLQVRYRLDASLIDPSYLP